MHLKSPAYTDDPLSRQSALIVKNQRTPEADSGLPQYDARVYQKSDEIHLKLNKCLRPRLFVRVSASLTRRRAAAARFVGVQTTSDSNTQHQAPPLVSIVAPLQLLAQRNGPLEHWRGGPKPGMSNPTTYTPLESLFLFQSLLNFGIDAAAFTRISETLQNNALIKGGETYDAARLSPSALQQLFLLLLREELKSDAERAEAAQAGASPSKRRKITAPSIPTLKEAYQHVSKVPALVERLYGRYRDHVVRQIREDERKFATVQKEIQLLEKSEKERLARSASQSGAPVLAPRDSKNTSLGSNSPSPSPGPTAGGAVPGIKRGTVVPTPKVPGSSAPSPTVAGHPHFRAGTPPVRPSPPPKPASGIQSPAGPPPQPQQQPLQPARPGQTVPAGRPGAVPSGLKPHPGGQIGIPQYGPPQNHAGQAQIQQAQTAAQQRPIPNPPSLGHAQPPHSQGASLQHPPHRPIAASPAQIPGRPIQPHPQNLRPLASASPHPTPATHNVPPKLAPVQPAPGQQQPLSRTHSPAHLDKSPYGPPKPAIPEHMIRQAVSTPQGKRSAAPSQPQTPVQASSMPLTRGFGTKWASHSTPSTPRPIMEEPESPAFEPVSPPQRASSIARGSSRSVSVKETPKKLELAGRNRSSRTSQRGRALSSTPSVAGTRRSQSVVSQPDEPSTDYHTKVKKEVSTPRLPEETGDTTADESTHGKQMATPGSVSSRAYKRKRQDTPREPPAPPTHVLWTRGFTKVSSSALDQISSHRDANMFATGIRERDAPGYHQIVLQPQDITKIRAAIKHGNKAASSAASNLAGGDPGGPNVWLPISEDLTPPQSIINSAQLERELVHMFCNAIMYNPDPDRGPGRAFMKRLRDEEEEVVGYRVDEDGVVRNTRGMFVEVEKLLSDLRNAEKDREPPPPAAASASTAASGIAGAIATTETTAVAAAAASTAEDTADEDDEVEGDGSLASKRRRVSARG
ncbi:Bromodomain [Cordyceps javanica]|uniref:Bromodomain n=1 Tax=Cordyceps javanica TaxID=43265 RepID=A0A545W4D7_9HYPO|nr:Bromodomain [Cordyceps javanica]TQW08800.1 Bromodomain [Cordyceps javanica]